MSKTAILLILDRSGSMQSQAEDVRGGFRAFLEEQKELPGEATLSLVQFDNAYEQNYSHLPLAEVPELVYAPRGGTSLLDAIGRGVADFTTDYEALPEAERPSDILVVVMTDGGENGSREWTKAKVQDLITEKTALGWEFAFLGADMDAVGDAATLGIQNSYNLMAAGAGANLSWAQEGELPAFSSMSRAVASYRSGTGYVDLMVDGNDPVKMGIETTTSTTVTLDDPAESK